jgi:transaldolase/glucose-6-phosphate isomerase
MSVATNPLIAVTDLGQSLWYDNIRRGMLDSGELERLVAHDGLRGVTSNPAIFEKAIAGSADYAEAIDGLRADRARDAKALYEALAVRDIQDAADVLLDVYERTGRRDGYVSLEVSPVLAHDTDGTVAEAVRLWRTVERPNLMVKVPATPAGIPAVRRLIAAGINVNVTLLFATSAYEQVAEAYLSGLEAFEGDPAHVASVASFFISRIDSAVDAELGVLSGSEHLRGQAAIANAKLTYQRYRELYAGTRWKALADRGAQTQRLLWASTSTKDPRYPDVRYIEELIGPDTVNTVPPVTFDAFRDHGSPRPSLEEDLDEAREVMRALGDAGIDFDQVTDRLLDDAVSKFATAFEGLLGAVEQACSAPSSQTRETQHLDLPAELGHAVHAALTEWQEAGSARRLWARDADLWTAADEAQWLGWLGIAREQLDHPEELDALRDDVRDAGFEHALLLGMGGSSLGPEMLALTFGRQDGFPRLHVLDSTDPAQVRAAEQAVDLASTLFIVASKSGSTLEPNIFRQHFLARASATLGDEEAARRFVAITDPGSKVEAIAREDGFRHVAHGRPSIGGRYSALSNFGMVPAAVMGLDVRRLLERADAMAQACASCVAADANPGVVLGVLLGTAARRGADKLTLVTSPGIGDFGAWLEQLIAESTGKHGQGIIPVDREPLGAPEVYGRDRLFAYVRLASEPDPAQDEAMRALAHVGCPVVRIDLEDRYDLGAEIFRWEFATAVAGAVLGINPFDQPDVEASKVVTRQLTGAYEEVGALPPETPFWTGEDVRLFADAPNAERLTAAGPESFADVLRAHLDSAQVDDYVALLAYVPMTAEHEAQLTDIRTLIRDRRRLATCVGFGPRFLHSTGQAYKGGPNSGVLVQITCDDADDVQVPGQRYTFGVVKAAQARGDFQVLAERGRRALRIHLGTDVGAGLAAVREAVERALA